MNDIIGTAGAPHDPSRLATDTTPAIVALGSNLGDREATIDRAIERIVRVIGPCHAQSRLIETEAWIHPDDDADWHPPFLNGVAVFDTGLGAAAILRHLLEIETSLGRERSADAKPWQPRPIDLDLIGVGAEVLDSPDLVLPHPRMHERRFVLEPLTSIMPDWHHPLLGKTAKELLEALHE